MITKGLTLVPGGLAHGYSGLRRIVTAKGQAAVYSRLAAAWCAAVAVLGIVLLIYAGDANAQEYPGYEVNGWYGRAKLIKQSGATAE